MPNYLTRLWLLNVEPVRQPPFFWYIVWQMCMPSIQMALVRLVSVSMATSTFSCQIRLLISLSFSALLKPRTFQRRTVRSLASFGL
ncbi:MAG: hypothetical protein ACK56F_02905 [bacterium]